MHVGAGAADIHCLEERVTRGPTVILLDQKREQVAGVAGTLLHRGRQADGQAGECVHVTTLDGFAPLPGGFHARQLMNTDGRLQIHHVVFEATLNDLVMLVELVAKAMPDILAHLVQGQNARAMSASSRPTIIPPSPVVMFLVA